MEKNKLLLGVLVMAVTVAVVSGGFKLLESPTGDAVSEDSSVKEFDVKAFRFGYSPDTITVNKGDKVRINIENTDTLHGIRIPDLGVSGNEVLEFTAGNTGEFTWYCNVMCGPGHMSMKGRVIVK